MKRILSLLLAVVIATTFLNVSVSAAPIARKNGWAHGTYWDASILMPTDTNYDASFVVYGDYTITAVFIENGKYKDGHPYNYSFLRSADDGYISYVANYWGLPFSLFSVKMNYTFKTVNGTLTVTP